MKKLILIIFTVTISALFAQDYTQYIKNVPGLEKYPDASAIDVFSSTEISINTDGTVKKHIYYIRKVLTYKGKTRYSDVKINYNADHEKITLGECFSVRDGKKIPIPKEAFHDNETYMKMYSPDYINERQKVVNFPAVEVNDFIVVDYTVEINPVYFYSDVLQMQTYNPALKREIKITYDKNLKLNYKAPKDAKESKTEKDGKIISSWEINNVPAIKQERNSPSLTIIGKPFFVSTKSNWEQAVKIYFEQFNSVNYNTKEVSALVKEYADSKMSNLLKLQKIYAYIQDNFNFKYMWFDYGVKPQAPEKVLEQKYGSPKELTALFIAMAKACHINVKQVINIGNTNVPEYKEIPCTKAVSGIFAYYEGNLFEFRTQYFPFGKSWTTKAFFISKDEPSKITTFNADVKALIDKKTIVNLNKDNTANAEFTTKYKSLEDADYRRNFKNMTPKKRKIWLSDEISDKSVNMIGEPVFKNIDDYTKDLEISYKAKINNFYISQDNYLYFTLPETNGIDVNLTGKNRENPYQIYSPVSINEVYEFNNIPAGYSVVKPSKDIVKTLSVSDDIKMNFKISASFENGKLIVKREIFIPKTIVPAEKYADFSAFISDIKKPLNTMIFLRKN